MNTKTIKFDLNKYKLYEKIKAKQGDTKSRFLLFQLLDGSVPFNLKNRSVRAYMIKPDGKEIFNDLIVNNYNLGYCTLELTNQVLAVPGTVKIELMVTEEEKKLTSSVFEVEVVKSINSEKSIVSTNEFTALLNGLAALSEYDNYKNAVKEMEINKADKAKVEEKFGEVYEQLDNIENKLESLGYIIPDWFDSYNENDSTKAIQECIDYCYNLQESGKNLYVKIDKTYIIYGSLYMKKGVKIKGNGLIKVYGIGTIAFDFDNCLYASIEDVKIDLMDINQIGLNLHSSNEELSSSQLNRFRDLTINGGLKSGTIGVKIDKSWSNTFSNCFLIRNNYGCVFEENANGNSFVGGEFRGDNTSEINCVAIQHNGGGNNTLDSAILENFRQGIVMNKGKFTITNTYLEGFSQWFVAFYGGNITIDNNYLKGIIQVYGDGFINFTNNDCTRMKGMVLNQDFPFITFREDVSTVVNIKNNIIPDDTLGYVINYNKYYKDRVSNDMTKCNVEIDTKESVLFENIPSIAQITGDGTDYALRVKNDNNTFYIKNGGKYRIEVQLECDGLTANNKRIQLVMRTTGTNQKVYTIGEQQIVYDSTRNRNFIKGIFTFESESNKSYNIYLIVDGEITKNVGISTTGQKNFLRLTRI